MDDDISIDISEISEQERQRDAEQARIENEIIIKEVSKKRVSLVPKQA